MRLLITGAEGMLGSDLLKVLGKEHEIIPLTYEKADITKKDSLDNFLKKYPAPEFIIHAAAYTDVDGAETNRAAALTINRTGTENLVAMASQRQIPLLYVSTDYVFSGQSDEPYLEDSATGPINYYGLTKLQGEEAVKKLPKFFIVRTSWLYGKNGKNFVLTMLDLAQKNKVLKVVNDQKGSPTYTKDLAEAIARLIKTKNYGIYHLTNSGQTSWFELAKKIFQITGFAGQLVPVATREFPRPAPRPPYSVLSHRNWLKIGMPAIRFWEEALEDFIINDLGVKK